ncbi:glycosyl transferase [Vibrio nigripulchritudo]|uniref:glycosyl transferase family protein n=1 Tax=Vibrio nigripulchritudo TaxID=28173 RepID=UPI00190BEC15|nr:glycosyl transferase family protein [Vibrio nigripulchritudo]BCL71837.1 glycosyl transferase [Vibrio nigripulchritudo]BDU33195.1 glycosyl transferase [Vibrio nigripulchritudo]
MSIAVQCIRALGKGERGKRSLTEDEAFELMTEWLAGNVGDDQLAMILVLMRVNNETAEEVGGFVRAFRARFSGINADLDWPLYAGKRIYENKSTDKPWHLVAAKILASNGYKILLHGHAQRHLANKTHAETFLSAVGIECVSSYDQAQQVIDAEGIAYLPLEAHCPEIVKLLSWSKRYGVRTPINTMVRGLNPGLLPYGLRGSFHPSYSELHARIEKIASADSLRVLSFKGVAGETEFNPKVSQTVWEANENLESQYWEEMTSCDIPVATSCVVDTKEPDLEAMSYGVVGTMMAALYTILGNKEQAEANAIRYWKEYLT